MNNLTIPPHHQRHRHGRFYVPIICPISVVDDHPRGDAPVVAGVNENNRRVSVPGTPLEVSQVLGDITKNSVVCIPQQGPDNLGFLRGDQDVRDAYATDHENLGLAESAQDLIDTAAEWDQWK